MNKKRTFSILVLAAVIGMVGVAGAESLTIDQAGSRIRNTLQQLEVGKNPTIGTEMQQPSVPDIEGVKPTVPVFKDYGHDKNASVDPMAIAAKYDAPAPDLKSAEKSDLMVFVSFSMPEASLKRIAVETAKAGGVMVIRGFKDDSLKATIAATEELAALHGELLIHPDLFDHYHISEVPVTVLAKATDQVKDCAGNEEEGLCTEQYQVKGDVSLHEALDYFTHKKGNPTLQDMAKAKLAQLERIEEK